MARDRLAELRAQQQQSRANDVPTNPSSPNSNGGSYEMSPVSSARGDMASFYAEISFLQDRIRTLNENISRIGDLHSRSLGQADDVAAQRTQAELYELVETTRTMSNDLKTRIKALEREPGSGRDAQIRKQQTSLVKSNFVQAIQNYQTVEHQNRTKYKQRMERQFKIVKPDATPEEVRAAVNEGGGQIFQQAMLDSDRYNVSRAAYREVQERHQDVKKIEATLAELAQLFNDMSILVEQQQETIETIGDTAQNVEHNVEQGLQQTEKAVESARRARRGRWICFIIFIVILAVVAIALAVELTKR